MKHRMSVVMIALLLVSLLLPCALAEGIGLKILDAGQSAEGQGIWVSIENVLPDADKAENYRVTLGGNTLEVQSVTEGTGEPVAEGDESAEDAPAPTEAAGTSWIFLVDVSTVSTDSNTSYKLTATLESLFDMIGSKDNAALVTTAMAGPEDLTSGRTSLKNQMKEATKYDKSANKLYDAVIQSLNFLTTSDKALANKCLVVLSKGDNRNGTASLSDVLDVIDEAPVAVYTIAYIDSGASRDYGSMAQESIKSGHGGGEINKDTVGSGSIEDAAASYIQRAERERRKEGGESADTVEGGYYIIQTGQPREKGVDNTVVVNFKGEDLSASAAYVINTDVEYPKRGFFEWLFTGLKRGDIACVGIVAGVAVLLALAVMLIIRAAGKKKNQEVNYNAGEVVTPPSPVSPVSIVDASEVSTVVTGQPQRKRLQVTLREASGKIHRAMLSQDGVSAGRQGDNHIVLDSNDKRISRHHFKLRQNGDEVVLESVSETNGTYVNGMRVEGPIALRQKDVIRAGGTEMTVSWKYE